jgi:hypothetical protein
VSVSLPYSIISGLGFGGSRCHSRPSVFLDVCFFVNRLSKMLLRHRIVTIIGLVFGAESALIEHENRRRKEENILRREARLDLARRGLIGTETEIAKWKATRKEQRHADQQVAGDAESS